MISKPFKMSVIENVTQVDRNYRDITTGKKKQNKTLFYLVI